VKINNLDTCCEQVGRRGEDYETSTTWSVTLGEEHRLMVLEDTVLKNTLRLKKDELTGGWRRRHNEVLHGPYATPNVIRVIKNEMGDGCGARGGEEKCVQGFDEETCT
jgi:hypothetical protein